MGLLILGEKTFKMQGIRPIFVGGLTTEDGPGSAKDPAAAV